MTSFASEVGESARRTFGFVGTVAAVGVGVLAFYIDSKTTVTARTVVICAIGTLAFLCVLLDLAWRMFRKARSPLPKVRTARSMKSDSGTAFVLLLSSSELFAHDVAVSIYSELEEFEVLIGLGRVLTIQENGLIQVLVTRRLESYNDIWKAIGESQKAALGRLVVKPTVPMNYALSEESQ